MQDGLRNRFIIFGRRCKIQHEDFCFCIAFALFRQPRLCRRAETPLLPEKAELCGRWEGGFLISDAVFIYGNYLRWLDGFYTHCQVLLEERHNGEPYSLLKCDRAFLIGRGERVADKFDHQDHYVLLSLPPRQSFQSPVNQHLEYQTADNFGCTIPGLAIEPAISKISGDTNDPKRICHLDTFTAYGGSIEYYYRLVEGQR